MGTANALIMKLTRLTDAYINILCYKEHFIKVTAQKKIGLLYRRFRLSRITCEKGLGSLSQPLLITFAQHTVGRFGSRLTQYCNNFAKQEWTFLERVVLYSYYLCLPESLKWIYLYRITWCQFSFQEKWHRSPNCICIFCVVPYLR